MPAVCRCAASALLAGLAAAAGALESGARPAPANASGLGFLECEGPGFDPAWAEFRRRLPRLARGAELGEELLARAAGLLDLAESPDLAVSVAAFSARLRGDEAAERELGGFCLFGTVAAYAAIAVHLDGAGPGAGAEARRGAKSWLARALLLLAKKQTNDFLESSGWPVRSADLVALLEGADMEAVRALPRRFQLPCRLALGCGATLRSAEAAVAPPAPPLPAAWPEEVAAVGMHATSTLEAVTALRDAVAEAWGRGGAAARPFGVRYAGHPCPSHASSLHQCEMRCELLGSCGPEADAGDPLAEFIAGAVDVVRFEEREGYSLAEARAALRWAPRRLAPLAAADLLLCTFPTVLCVLLHELFPQLPLLFVAIANPLFAAPGCARREDSTVRECESPEAWEYLAALRAMLQRPSVTGLAAYTVTAALVGHQAGMALPLAGKAARYLPAGAAWRPRRAEVLLARSRFLETPVGAHLRTLLREFSRLQGLQWSCVPQQELAAYLPYEELGAFRAVVILPQDLGLHKFTEHYAMAMPIWMPAREWAYRLQASVPWGMVAYSGSWRGGAAGEGGPGGLSAPGEGWPGPGAALARAPHFNAQTVPFPLADAAFWYEFSEFVAYPAVQAFGSVPGLLAGLDAADLAAISGEMRRFRAALWRTTRAVYAEAAGRLAEAAASAASAAAPTPGAAPGGAAPAPGEVRRRERAAGLPQAAARSRRAAGAAWRGRILGKGRRRRSAGALAEQG